MRIVLAAAEYSWPNYAGGIKTYTQIIAKNLARLGHEVHIITTEVEGLEPHYEKDGVYIHCVEPRRILPRIRKPGMPSTIHSTKRQSRVNDLLGTLHLIRRSWRVRNEVQRLASSGGVDIVEVPDWGAEGFWLTLRPFIPVVVTLHGPRFFLNKINGWHRTLGMRASENLEKQVILRASMIVSPSSTMCRMVSQEYQMASLEEKIQVIPNPVDTVLFKPVSLNNHNLQQQALTITYIGRLELLKGVPILAAAIPTIKKAYPEAKFRFIGSDTLTAPGGGSMQTYLSSQLKDYIDAVEFTGPLPRHTLPGFFTDSTLVVLPSLGENLPYVCAEAMACGACVVASRVGGFTEMIIEGEETGFLVPAGDAEALGSRIIHLLEKPNERKRVGVNARAFILKNMNANKITSQKLELYEHLIKRLNEKRPQES